MPALRRIASARARHVTLAAVMAMALTACDQPAQSDGAGEAPPPPVTVAAVQMQDVEVVNEYSGRARASREVEVRARVEGILEERLYVEGQAVEEGAPLFRIDPEPYEIALQRAQAERAQAVAELNQARRNYERTAQLLEREAISERQYDEAYFQQSLAEARLALADAAVADAERNLRYTTVAAPVAGLADMKTLSEGNLIDRGTLLTSITQHDPIHVRFSFPETDAAAQWAARRSIGGSEEVRREARLMHSGGDAYGRVGTVDFTDATVDPRTGTVSARAVFENPDMDVVPGQFVRIALVVEILENAALIPEVAVGEGRDGPRVFVVDEDNVAHARAVRLGPVVDQGQVVLEGLEDGDRVVIRGQVALADGRPVSPEKAGGGEA